MAGRYFATPKQRRSMGMGVAVAQRVQPSARAHWGPSWALGDCDECGRCRTELAEAIRWVNRLVCRRWA